MTNTSAQKFKILIVAETYPPEINGAARFGQRLAEGLFQRGHAVYVLAPCNDKGKSFIQDDKGIVVYRLRSHAVPGHLTFRICFPWQIKKEIQAIFDELKPDIVHVQCHFSIGRLAIYEANRRQIPVLATIHVVPDNVTPYLPLPKWSVNLLVKYLSYDLYKVLSKVNLITIPTDLGAQAIYERIDLPLLTVSNGINCEDYVLKSGEVVTRQISPSVLFVGRLAREKNIDVLINAIAKLPPEFNVHLKIVGHGEILNELQNLTDRLNISTRVKFLGILDEKLLREAYLQASLFCMPGNAELQSLAALEAMSASLPVVLADALALPHLIIEGRNGYLFQPGDSSDLAEKILKIIELPEELRLKMGQSSCEIAAKHNISDTITRYENLYREIKFPQIQNLAN